MVEHTRATKRTKFSGNIITVKIGTGKDQKTFSIHEDIVKETSLFFRAALDKKWKEGQAREIKLPDDLPEVVSCYVDWCYTKKIPSARSSADAFVDAKELRDEYDVLARLYVFGEKAQDDAFCDAVITAFTEVIDQGGCKEAGGPRLFFFPESPSISIIYGGTPINSPARRFVVDMFISYGRKDWVKNKRGYLENPEFLQDLVVAQLDTKGKAKPEGEAFDRRKEWFKEKK